MKRSIKNSRDGDGKVVVVGINYRELDLREAAKVLLRQVMEERAETDRLGSYPTDTDLEETDDEIK